MKLFIIIHTYKYGENIIPVLAKKKPSEEAVIELLGEDWDSEREEYVSIEGPLI